MQDKVCELIQADTILTGQSLGHDLQALHILHPFVIDSCDIFQFKEEHQTTNLGERFPILVQTILTGIDIYRFEDDTIYSIKLLKAKLRQDCYFGDIRRGGWIPATEHIARIAEIYQYTNISLLAMQVVNDIVTVVSAETAPPTRHLAGRGEGSGSSDSIAEIPRPLPPPASVSDWDAPQDSDAPRRAENAPPRNGDSSREQRRPYRVRRCQERGCSNIVQYRYRSAGLCRMCARANSRIRQQLQHNDRITNICDKVLELAKGTQASVVTDPVQLDYACRRNSPASWH